MAASDFKIRLEAFLAEQQASLDKLEAQYQTEKSRLREQILKTSAVLEQFDKRVEGLITTLEEAGVRIKVEN